MFRVPALFRPQPPPASIFSIPKRFEDPLFAHLAGNFWDLKRFPLIYAIHGPPGHGKSYQLSVLLDFWRVGIHFVGGAQLESPIAGGPAQAVTNAYLAANEQLRQTGVPQCLIIDDIDAGIGDFGKSTTYTVNRQNVSVSLMALADNPKLIRNQPVSRVPIIVTANRIETLYEPLRRPGRMTSFRWEITPGEQRAIAVNLFQGLLGPQQIDRLLGKLPTATPAILNQVWSELVANELLLAANDTDRGDYLRRLVLQRGTQTNWSLGSPEDQARRLTFAIKFGRQLLEA